MITRFHAFSSNFNATVTIDADAWSGYMPDAPQGDMNQNCLSVTLGPADTHHQ